MPDFSLASTAKSVHASLDEAFAAIPDGHRGAFFVLADETGARAVVAARIGDHWQLAAGADKPWHGPVSGLVGLMGSW